MTQEAKILDDQLIKRCPFCGHRPSLKNVDTLHRASKLNDQLYVFNCAESWGGCGASVISDEGPQGAIDLWNTRFHD